MTVKETKALVDFSAHIREVQSMSRLMVSQIDTVHERVLAKIKNIESRITKLGESKTPSEIEKQELLEENETIHEQLKGIKRNYKTIKGTLLCLHIDSFQTYLSDLLSLIFITNPNTLRSSEQKVSVEEILRYRDRKDLIEAIAEKRIDKLTYMGFAKMAGELKKRIGLQLLDTDDDNDRMSLLIEVRNLVTHNRGIINSRFISKVKDERFKVGERVELDAFEDDMFFIVQKAAQIDIKAIKKFKLS